MKKIFTLLTLLLTIVGGASAITYTVVYDMPTTLNSGKTVYQNTTATMTATSATDGANAQDLQIDASHGKLGHNNDNTWAQIIENTILIIPGVPAGATISSSLYSTTAITIEETAYTTNVNHTTTHSGNVVMKCTTGGYMGKITVTCDAPFKTTYSTVYDIATTLYNGGSVITYQGNSGVISATTSVAAANAKDLQVDASSGKLGGNNESWAQINNGTVLTLPNVPTGATISFNLYDTTPLTIGGTAYTNGTTYTTTSAGDVTMTCTADGYIKSITVLGEPFCENITIATSGYSSFCSSKPLDLANLPTGLTAYQVTGASTTATLEAVTTAVAANTGLILKGTPGTTYAIPVTTTGTSISATNKLVGVTTPTTLSTGDYVLKDGAFHIVNTSGSPLPAFKAYLPAASIPSSREILEITVDPVITGIENIKVGTEENVYYDLQGRRILYPSKGLYIVNGKKVVIK